MGLDVYLKHSVGMSPAESLRMGESANDAGEKLWDQYTSRYAPDGEKMPKEIVDQYREELKELYSTLGCNWGGQSANIETVEIDSKIDPSHSFKIGYFRSSYNSAGTNSVLSRYGISTLDELFCPPDEYEFIPNWEECLARVDAAIAKFEDVLDSEHGRFDVVQVMHPWRKDNCAPDATRALNTFMKERNQFMSGPNRSFGNYGSATGDFWFNGALEVHAVIPGKNETFLIVSKAPNADGKEDWYLTALRIVKETIEYVLAQPDKENYFVAWSG